MGCGKAIDHERRDGEDKMQNKTRSCERASVLPGFRSISTRTRFFLFDDLQLGRAPPKHKRSHRDGDLDELR
jgi:hypothetical protein